MHVCIDIEANGLVNPDTIWLIVCKDIDTNEVSIFRRPTHDVSQQEAFLSYAAKVDRWIGHNLLDYDLVHLRKLIGLEIPDPGAKCIDTLLVSRLVDYDRDGGHSLEKYGQEFELGKLALKSSFKEPDLVELEAYCVRDVEICHRIYLKYLHILTDPNWASSILLEHQFQLVVNALHDNGFGFNTAKATNLLTKVSTELEELDGKIKTAFPPQQVKIRDFIPKATKYGTISKTSVPRSLWPRMAEYQVGETYGHYRVQEFNPSSHKQLVHVLVDAGWKPTDKTKTHTEAERTKDLVKLEKLALTGWKINETNLSTLPPDAPSPARLLAKRILLESRRRTLTEWLSLVGEDNRIHGHFYGIGAWTGRMAHQRPNTANIPNEFDTNGNKKLLGKELRSLWCAPRNRLLVGVDAEGIQLRIFAHLIDDKEFTDALTQGKKSDKTDPHSLNQRILGSCCKTRQAAKRFIYALLLGAGIGKLAEILDCGEAECRQALDRVLQRYTGWRYLREKVFPRDAKRGYFIGLDGRQVPIPGESVRDRQHLAMSGYLQSGEAIVMKRATLNFFERLKDDNAILVDLVHDEWQIEVPNNLETAIRVGTYVSDSLVTAGRQYELKCPLAGSFYNDDKKTETIGTNWSVTH